MSEKPIREYDRFILRLPDGMRERLQLRANANGRSMNAETIAILQQALNDPGDMTIEGLAQEGLKLSAIEEAATVNLQAAQARLEAIRDELRRIFGSATRNHDPLTYALRIYPNRQSRERKPQDDGKDAGDDAPDALKGTQG